MALEPGGPGAAIRTVSRALSFLLLVATSLVAIAGPVWAEPLRTSVTMVSDPGDYIGGGQARVFHTGNAEVTVSGSPEYLNVSVSGGSLGDSFGLTFAAPPGKRLKPGFYDGAQRAPFREAGRPGIDISGDGRGCNTIEGRFDVKDIVTGGGEIQRLWITYEQHCEGGTSALFGEVRIEVPETFAPIWTAPRHVWWPDTPVGTSGTIVPVQVVGGRAHDGATIAHVGISGLHRQDFQIRVDDCTGAVLGPSESCELLLRFSPSVAGPRVGQLVIRTDAGDRRIVALDGAGLGGRTRFVIRSDEGDFVGGGETYRYTPLNASISMNGTRQLVQAWIDGDDGRWWSAEFDAPDGDVLAAGTTYEGALRYPFNGGSPGIDVSGDGRGCNEIEGTFTVQHLQTHPDGTVRSLDVDFEQHCEGADPALRGTLEFRLPVGDITPPPGATGLDVVRDGSRVLVSWAPLDADVAAFLLRSVPGVTPPPIPNAGILGGAGLGTSAVLRGVDEGRPLAVALFTVDAAGNVARAATAVLEANP